jgi:uncharacterized membrane protein YgcG
MIRMVSQKAAVFALVVLAAFICFFLPQALVAQNQCDEPVLDEANVFNGRLSDVEGAVNRLRNTGADVRVRMIPTYGEAGNLDRYESELEQQCASWTDLAGNRKNNLVALIVSIEEMQTGIYFGEQWEPALGDRWTQIQTQIMNPRFARGDFAGGVIAGLDEINRLIAAQLGDGGGPPGQGGLSAGWVILIVFFSILIIGVGLLIFRNYRKSREKRLAARQKARLAKQGAASKVNDLVSALQMLEIKVNATAQKVSQEDAAPLFDGLSKAKRLIDQGAQKYSELSHSAGDPEKPGTGVPQLEVIAQEYQGVINTLREGNEELNKTEERITALQNAIESFSGRLDAVNAAIEEAVRKQETARNAGFKIDQPAGVLDNARLSLKQAAALYQGKQFIQAVHKLEEAGDLAKQAAVSAETLPEKKRESEEAILNLEKRLEKVRDAVERGSLIFDKISQKYAETSWESIRGNGTEAENRIDWTQEALEDARAGISMEQQEWQKALELVQQGHDWMNEAESLMHSITALEASLTAAERDAPQEIEAAQVDITRAWQYINQYDEDIRESLEDELRQAESVLESAREEFNKEKADYLKTVKLAEEANTAADKILAQARSEHEAAERLRQKAASAIRDARYRVSIAREYIQDHAREAGSDARTYLSSAESALRQAEGTADLEARITYAGKAENAAAAAYSSARSRVAEAWDRRQAAIPPVIFIPGGGGWWGGSTWGSRRGSPSGRSESPRRSGGSGGGSTGWGGRKGGGGGGRRGGSTGW